MKEEFSKQDLLDFYKECDRFNKKILDVQDLVSEVDLAKFRNERELLADSVIKTEKKYNKAHSDLVKLQNKQHKNCPFNPGVLDRLAEIQKYFNSIKEMDKDVKWVMVEMKRIKERFNIGV